MIFKPALFLILLAASLPATVFDYRYYYGSVSGESNKINGYSTNIYTYFNESNFSYGAQIEYAKINNTLSITDLTGSLGYDLSKNTRAEINLGSSYTAINEKYYNGYNISSALLYQVVFDSFLEAFQVGMSIKYNWYSAQEIEKSNNTLKEKMRIVFFVGVGF